MTTVLEDPRAARDVALIPSRVQEGIDLLYNVGGHAWEDVVQAVIDNGRFDVAEFEECILSALYGSYHLGCEALSIGMTDVDYGFTGPVVYGQAVDEANTPYWDELQAEWNRRLRLDVD